MDKIIKIAKKNWLYLAGALLGGVGGYLYWYYIGCSTGTCPITASPTMSVIWGALMGGLLFNILLGRKENKQ